MAAQTLKKTVAAKVATVLYQQEYETLKKMLESKDKADHTMVQALLNQCDVKASIYWIWKLSKSHVNKMVYLRTLNSRIFRDECELFIIFTKESTEMALYLHQKGWLTPEIYQLLKPDILDELAIRNSYGNFYKIFIEIKDKYRKFDPESTNTYLFTYLLLNNENHNSS